MCYSSCGTACCQMTELCLLRCHFACIFFAFLIRARAAQLYKEAAFWRLTQLQIAIEEQKVSTALVSLLSYHHGKYELLLTLLCKSAAPQGTSRREDCRGGAPAVVENHAQVSVSVGGREEVKKHESLIYGKSALLLGTS